jgi:hypothetical protein
MAPKLYQHGTPGWHNKFMRQHRIFKIFSGNTVILTSVGNHTKLLVWGSPSMLVDCYPLNNVISLRSWAFCSCCNEKKTLHEYQCRIGNEYGAVQLSPRFGILYSPQHSHISHYCDNFLNKIKILFFLLNYMHYIFKWWQCCKIISICWLIWI